MPSLLRMPEVSANDEEATLTAWGVAENATYAAADTLATVETAKASVDVEADEAGVVVKLLVDAGTDVRVGDPIAIIAAPGEAFGDVDSVMAELGLSGAHVTAAGDVTANMSGAEEGRAVSAAASVIPASAAGERRFVSPLARRLAREAGIDLAATVGTGPNGRITRGDVRAAAAARNGRAVEATPPGHGFAPDNQAASTVVPADSVIAADALIPADTPRPLAAVEPPLSAGHRDVPHTKLRRAIATRLTESKRTAPHFYLSGVARVDRLLALRTDLNAAASTRISVNDLLVKAIGRAHTMVPRMNVIWTDDYVRQFTSVDVAVAVATDAGLITPVVRSVDRRSISAVAVQTRDYVERARAGRLRQHELEGGSITITNLGMYGTREFVGIINPPQASILAVGAASPEPVVKRSGKLGKATLLHVVLSVDHRPVDGAVAAEWMQAFVSVVEQPLQIVV